MEALSVDELELFEDMHDMLRGVVKALGGYKMVGPMFKPELTVESAAGWVRDRLDPNRRERFDAEQILFLFKKAREVGYHAGMRWLASECGYSTPRPLEIEEEEARVVQVIDSAADTLGKAMRTLERIRALRAVA